MLLSPLSANAEWRRLTDITLNTAYTLEEASLSVGLFSPLSVGVTDNFQASLHPLLLLLGQPSLALRLRLNALGDITTALNLSGAWSFIDRETSDGARQASEGESFGFPGRVQLAQTTSFRLGDQWLLSLGNGFALDFLGSEPVRASIELHGSLHVLITSRHMVLVQLLGYLPLTEVMSLREPSAQVVYAWAPNARLHVALGLGFGEWLWEKTTGDTRKLHVFPVLDLWFHF